MNVLLVPEMATNNLLLLRLGGQNSLFPVAETSTLDDVRKYAAVAFQLPADKGCILKRKVHGHPVIMEGSGPISTWFNNEELKGTPTVFVSGKRKDYYYKFGDDIGLFISPPNLPILNAHQYFLPIYSHFRVSFQFQQLFW